MPSKFGDPEHPDTTPADWKTFRRQFSPFLIDAVVDRSATNFPDSFVPLARGVAIASSALLRQAGYRPGMGVCPTAQVSITPDECILEIDGDNRAMVRRCGSFWTVEWWNDDRHHHVLVHSFGSTPIVTRCCESASYLAVACQGGTGHSLRWINGSPINYQSAIEFAKKRRIDESLAQSNFSAVK